MPLKISLLGPESTGKSVLGKALADHYNGIYVPEYARTYTEQLDRDYTYDDVCRIVEEDRRQMQASYPADFVFFDAGLIVDKVWLDVVYGRRPEWLNEGGPEDCQADFYLLTYPDIAWQADPTRENGSDDARLRLYQTYLHEIILTGKPYGIVRGQGPARTACAIRLIDNCLRNR